jgi:hypothetical protein
MRTGGAFEHDARDNADQYLPGLGCVAVEWMFDVRRAATPSLIVGCGIGRTPAFGTESPPNRILVPAYPRNNCSNRQRSRRIDPTN